MHVKEVSVSVEEESLLTAVSQREEAREGQPCQTGLRKGLEGKNTAGDQTHFNGHKCLSFFLKSTQDLYCPYKIFPIS